MLRLAELALFLSPIAAYMIWRLTAARGGPSPIILAAACCGVALLAGALVWFALNNTLPSGGRYVPAQVLNGRIIPGHTAAP